PSTSRPPGARRAAMRCQAPVTSASSYCRSTLNARITAGRRPPIVGTSNPPRAKVTRASRAKGVSPARTRRSWARAPSTRSGSISRQHLDVGTHRAQSRLELERGHPAAPVAEVDHQRVGGAAQRRMPGDPAVDAAQPVGVRRPAGDAPDRALGQRGGRHAPMMPGERLAKLRAMTAPHTLILLRHGQSTWNKSNQFTGWVDVRLTDLGKQEAQRGGELIAESGLHPDILHTSVLSRAIQTADIALDAADRLWIPVKR